MSYTYLDWWLIVLAYLGTFGWIGLLVLLLAPDTFERAWELGRALLGWAGRLRGLVTR